MLTFGFKLAHAVVESLAVLIGQMAIAVREWLCLLAFDDQVRGQLAKENDRLGGGTSEAIKSKFPSRSRMLLNARFTSGQLTRNPVDHPFVGIVDDDVETIIPTPSLSRLTLAASKHNAAVTIDQACKVATFRFCHLTDHRCGFIGQEMVTKSVAAYPEFPRAKSDRARWPIGQSTVQLAQRRARPEVTNDVVFSLTVMTV